MKAMMMMLPVLSFLLPSLAFHLPPSRSATFSSSSSYALMMSSSSNEGLASSSSFSSSSSSLKDSIASFNRGFISRADLNELVLKVFFSLRVYFHAFYYHVLSIAREGEPDE